MLIYRDFKEWGEDIDLPGEIFLGGVKLPSPKIYIYHFAIEILYSDRKIFNQHFLVLLLGGLKPLNKKNMTTSINSEAQKNMDDKRTNSFIEQMFSVIKTWI